MNKARGLGLAIIKHMLCVCGVLAALGSFAPPLGRAAGASERTLHKPTQQQKSTPRRRLSLLPRLCVEQFLSVAPAVAPGETTTSGVDQRPAPAAVPQRLHYATDWGVQPFVGATFAGSGEAPERNPTPGGAPLPGSAPFCQLDAGVSYNLSPGASLNLGYRLPSSGWSSMFGALSGEPDAPADKKVSVGISVDF